MKKQLTILPLEITKLAIKVTFLLAFFGIFMVTPPWEALAASNSWGLDGISYLSRADWGADESWRYTEHPIYQSIIAKQQSAAPTPETEAQRRVRVGNQYVLNTFPTFFKIDSIIREQNGKKLFWALQYAEKKDKIIVHHTATTTALPLTLEEEKEYMKSVYRFHAFSRGWWDIWYNFVIMPSGRIYEWRAWGAWVVWAHVTWNNTNSVGISLVWNFQWENKPTQWQLTSLINLSAAVAQKYNIDPYKKTYYFQSSTAHPYVSVSLNYALGGHKDGWNTACPGENVYPLLPDIREKVFQAMTKVAISSPTQTAELLNTTTPTTRYQLIPVGPNPAAETISTTQSSTQEVKFGSANTTAPIKNQFDSLSVARANYLDVYTFTKSQSSIQRLDWAPKIENIDSIENKLIRVLLYEASSLPTWNITCNPWCILRIVWQSSVVKSFTATAKDGLFEIQLNDKTLKVDQFWLSAYNTPTTSWTISLTNYARKASNGVPLNEFRQGMIFTYWNLKDEAWVIKNQAQVINLVSLDNYMKWIAEASDQEVQTKADLLALLSKAYAMYYMWWTIKHPSILDDALYNAIDDPRFFQKYLGVWREKISKKWPVALENTKNQYLVYNSTLPILPYFHCSAGFTWTAQEKRGWQDTPYLASVLDNIGACEDWQFQWHGVWLSWRWAATLLAKWASVADVITKYYPGVSILKK